jgi:hypothetical protein
MVNVMLLDVKQIAESTKITAERFAFGETTHARPIASELAWRSLNRGLGSLDISATSFLPSLLETEISATALIGGGAATSGFPCRRGAESLMRYI